MAYAWREYPAKRLAFHAGTSTINGQFYAIAKSLLPANASLLTTAELFARLGAAQFDSNVIGWYLKYYYLFWRPISAIRCAWAAASRAACNMAARLVHMVPASATLLHTALTMF